MPEIAFQRAGPAFPWSYAASGTTNSTLWLYAAITIRYSVADPDTNPPPPDDTIPPGILARQVVDPATYAGTLDGQPGAATFDTLHDKWLILTYAGAGKLLVIPQAHKNDLDAWLTQPDKTLAGSPPIFIPSPYGTDPKQYAILGAAILTHIIDYQET